MVQDAEGIEHYVWLKLGASIEGDMTINTVALKVTDININTSKNVPSIPIPLSGLITGESQSIALNLGMAQKTITVNGFLVDQIIKRSFDSMSNSNFNVASGVSLFPSKETTTVNGVDVEYITIEMTSVEIAQLIHSYTDSTTLQPYQNMNELIFLYESKVNSYYQYRNADKSADLVPFNFAARGNAGELDNAWCMPINEIPSATTDEGLSGFVRSFGTPITGESREIPFSLEFEVAMTL